MNVQKGNVPSKEEGELTSAQEAIKTETEVSVNTPVNFLGEGLSTSSLLVQTPKPVLRQNTRLRRHDRPPKFLGERFFTSSFTTDTLSAYTTTDTSGTQLMTASGPSQFGL